MTTPARTDRNADPRAAPAPAPAGGGGRPPLINLSGVLCCLVLLGTFLIDIQVPSSFPVWPAYMLAIWLSASWRGKPAIVLTAAVASALVAADHLLSPAEGDPEVGLVSKAFGLGVMVISALMVWEQEELLGSYRAEIARRRETEAMLARHADELDSRRAAALRSAQEADEARQRSEADRRALEEANRVLRREAEEREQAERRLRESRERYRSALETCSDAFVAIDAAGRITAWNRRAEALFGWPRGEALDRPLAETLLPPRYREAHSRALARFLENGQGRSFHRRLEVAALHRDGHEIPVELTIWSAREGGHWTFNAFLREIPSGRWAERERERFFAVSLDLLCVAGLDGYFKRVNPAFERVLGYTAEELVSRPFLDFVHPEDHAATLREVERLNEGEPTVAFANRYRCKDGSYRWIEWNATAFPIEGQIYAAARDVTDRKHAEETLSRKAEELARSNADLELFAHAAAHDLQEPLHVVRGYLDLLEMRFPGEVAGSAREWVGCAVAGCDHMQQLIAGLLEFSRVQTRGQPPVPADSAAALARALDGLRPAVAAAGAAVTAGELPTVRADPAQLADLFRHLIDNAVKFRGDRPPEVRVAAERDGAGWRFAVRDNGIGIDPARAEEVFVIFRRLHPRGEYSGVGVGLALCKRIVERHGGRIWLESRPGEGTTVYFTLPAGESGQRPELAEVPGAVAGAS